MMVNYSGSLAIDHGFVTDNEFVTRNAATEGHKVLALAGRAGRRCGNDGGSRVAHRADCPDQTAATELMLARTLIGEGLYQPVRGLPPADEQIDKMLSRAD
jgi:hypothetical protein